MTLGRQTRGLASHMISQTSSITLRRLPLVLPTSGPIPGVLHVGCRLWIDVIIRGVENSYRKGARSCTIGLVLDLSPPPTHPPPPPTLVNHFDEM